MTTSPSGKSVSTPPVIEIHPKFFLPPNVSGVKYVNNERDSTNIVLDGEGNEIPVGSTTEGDGSGGAGGTGSGLLPPESIEIISQTVRTDLFGRTLIDVVIEAKVASNVETLDRVVSIV